MQSTLLVIAEVLVALAVGYAIARYVVIPAMKKEDASTGSTGIGGAQADNGNTDKL